MKKLVSVILSVSLLLGVLPLGFFKAAAESRMYLDTEYSVNCSSAGDWDVRIFTPSESGTYIFSSSGSLDTLGYIALAKGEAENEYIKADGGQDNNFAVTYNMTAGVTYYMGSTVLVGRTGTYRIKVVKFEVDDGTIHEINLSQATTVSASASSKLKMFSLTPKYTGKYIYSSSGGYDTKGYVFDEQQRQIAFADDGGGADNFQLELDLKAGETYYLGYATTYASTCQFNILIYMEARITGVSTLSAPSRTEYIKNIDATLVSGNKYHADLILSGFLFLVQYSNGATQERKYAYGIRGLDCSNSVDLYEGNNYIPYSYMGYGSTFTVVLKDSPVQSISLNTLPDKSVYYAEDMQTAINGEKIFNISLYGMLLNVLYTDGTTDELKITSSYGEEIPYFYFNHTIPASQMQYGANSFTLSYYGKSLSFNVDYSLNSDNWQYEIVDGGVRLTKYIGSDVNAVIPETLDGYPVTVIGEGCFEENTALKSVKMNSAVTTVEQHAFYGCTSVKQLELPKHLTSVGKEAFFEMKALEKLYWNAENLTVKRSDNVFGYMGADVSGGTEVEFGFDCTAIPADAFFTSTVTYAPNISKITVGENVTSIGSNAFRELASLKEVYWNATQITGAIAGANNIWYNNTTDDTFKVYIGEYVRSLPNHLFSSSSSSRAPRVTQYTVESKDTVIADDTFKANASVPVVFYCRYNRDENVKSVYKFCSQSTDPNVSYVLMDAPVSRIFFEALPEQSEYIVGDALDLTGLSVIAEYEDGTQEEVTEYVSVSGYDAQSIGAQIVTVSYEFIGKTVSANFEVLVSEEPLVLDHLRIQKPADKTAFFTDEHFESSGLEVIAVFTSGFEQDVSEQVLIGGYDLNTPGTQSVSIRYNYSGVTREVQYEITVTAVVLSSIAITAPAEKTDYLAGESFDPSGLQVTAFYNSGKSAAVTSLCTFEGFDMNARGEQTVTVVYSEDGVSKTAAFPITVHNALQSVEILSLPTKQIFTLGTAFSAPEISVRAVYENGSTADISDAVAFSGYDLNQLGEQTVTVSFTDGGVEKSDTYSITVVPVELAQLVLVSEPTALQYVGEDFHSEGLVIHALFTNGREEDVTSEVSLSGYDKSVPGDQRLTATYRFADKSESIYFDVYLYEKTVTGIALVSKPTKTEYLFGEDLDTTGMQADVLFDNGTRSSIENSELELTGFNKTQTGTQTVTLQYTVGGKTFSTFFYASVKNYEASITVNAPTKTAYFYGEEFDRAGMSLVVHMADGSEKTIYSGFTLSGYNNKQLGEQSVEAELVSEVTGSVLSDSFRVTVADYETALQISAPTKTVYYVSEPIDTAGMSAMLTFASGSTAPAAVEKITLSGYQPERPGEQRVQGTYLNAKGEAISDSFSVNVLNYEKELSVSAPTKTEYFYGEALDTAGLSGIITMADGTRSSIDSSFLIFSGYQATVLGTQSVKAIYTNAKGEDLEAAFEVQVKDFETSLQVSAPAKTEYFYGEALNTDGLSATAATASGNTVQVDAGALRFSGYEPEQLGAQEVLAHYIGARGENLSDSFSVTVQNYIRAISVSRLPKTEYSYGEAFDDSDLELLATMADGTTAPLDKNLCSISGFDAFLVGEQSVTVCVNNEKGEAVQTSYTVRVNNAATSMHITAPDKTEYYFGEELDLTGLSADIDNLDGTTTYVDASGLSVSGFDPEKTGQQRVAVSYENEQGTVLRESFTVSVRNFEVSLTVTALGQCEYFYGDAFDKSGFAFAAVMADGSSQAVDSAAVTISGFESDKVGEKNLTASYTGVKGNVLSASFRVSVDNYETSMTLTAPSKKVYYCGEELDITGIRVLTVMADRKIKIADNARLSFTGYDLSTPGEQLVQVLLVNAKGETLSGSYKIEVLNFARSIAAVPPENTSVYFGESFDTRSVRVNAVMADGSEKSLRADSCTWSELNAFSLGEQTLSVAYTNEKGETLSDSLKVTVVNYPVSLLLGENIKTEYLLGEALETENLTVTAVFADGSRRQVQESAVFSGYDPNDAGEQTVTVTYSENEKSATATFQVRVQTLRQRADVNGDGFVDIADISEVLAQGNFALSAQSAQNSLADVNRDGEINVLDINVLVQEGVFAQKV